MPSDIYESIGNNQPAQQAQNPREQALNLLKQLIIRSLTFSRECVLIDFFHNVR